MSVVVVVVVVGTERHAPDLHGMRRGASGCDGSGAQNVSVSNGFRGNVAPTMSLPTHDGGGRVAAHGPPCAPRDATG